MEMEISVAQLASHNQAVAAFFYNKAQEYKESALRWPDVYEEQIINYAKSMDYASKHYKYSRDIVCDLVSG